MPRKAVKRPAEKTNSDPEPKKAKSGGGSRKKGIANVQCCYFEQLTCFFNIFVLKKNSLVNKKYSN